MSAARQRDGLPVRDRLVEGLEALGIELPAGSTDRLLAYLDLLNRWNAVYNLTAIREPQKLVTHHLLDCLAVLPHLAGESLADIGSGAGLPGIPLALARPQWRVVLVETNVKKSAFLRQAVVELGLPNVAVETVRVEQWTPQAHFDLVIARAFAELRGFAEVAGHLCAPGGRLVAMKGVYPDEELRDLPAGVTLERVLPLQVPGLDAARHLVFLRGG